MENVVNLIMIKKNLLTFLIAKIKRSMTNSHTYTQKKFGHLTLKLS